MYWLVSSHQKCDLDLGLRTFFYLFNKTLGKYAHMKQGMRKVQKLELKPRVTIGMKTSMKLWDKLYKEAIRKKDSQRKKKKYET